MYLKNRRVQKDVEGNTYDTYAENGIEITGEQWPASGKVQAQMYGERLAYIRNVKIKGKYETEIRNGILYYVFPDFAVAELDGLCIDVPESGEPDYRIISISPYLPLRMGVEKL